MKKSNSKLALLVLIIILLSSSVVLATGNIIITPKSLTGTPGSLIQVEKSLLVQEVTMTDVKLLDVHILNENDRIVTRFPNNEARYTVVEKGTDRKLGFIDIKPNTIGSEIPINYNLKGEYLFYQFTDESETQGYVFNTLGNAVEGDLYFFKVKSDNSGSIRLPIGEIKNGTLIAKDYIEVKNKQIQIKSNLTGK